MRSKHNTVPGLAVIMVGERRDSAKYVSMKQVSAREPGGPHHQPAVLKVARPKASAHLLLVARCFARDRRYCCRLKPTADRYSVVS